MIPIPILGILGRNIFKCSFLIKMSIFEFLDPPKRFLGRYFIFYTWGHSIRSQEKIFGVVLADSVGHCRDLISQIGDF